MEKEKTEGIPHISKTFEQIMLNVKQFEHPQTKEGEIKYTFSRKTDLRREEYRKVLRELLNFDTILTPQETISLGLADKIFG